MVNEAPKWSAPAEVLSTGPAGKAPVELHAVLGALKAEPLIERSDAILWQVVDLFERDAGRLSSDQVALFDLVLARLTDHIEAAARSALAHRLAGNAYAPPGLMQRLSMDDRIEIAGPVLSLSSCVGEAILVTCAETKGQPHLLALSRRAVVPKTLTDILVVRGDSTVLRSVAGNGGAQFSDLGFRTVVDRAVGDDDLTIIFGSRQDLPRHHALRLIAMASEAARIRLDAASSHPAEEVRAVVARVARLVEHSAQTAARDYKAADHQIEHMQTAGLLAEEAIADFAASGQMELLTAALAKLGAVSMELVDGFLRQERAEGILVLLRALGFSWATARLVLMARVYPAGISARALEQAAFSFERLKPSTAVLVLSLRRNRQTN